MRKILLWATVCLMASQITLADDDKKQPPKPAAKKAPAAQKKPARPAAKKPAKKPQQKPLPKPTHAYTGALLHDGTGRALPNAVILVGKGKVVAIGPAGGLKIPAGVKTISLAGKQVIPGLIDTASGLFLAASSDARGSKTTDLLKDGLDLYDREARGALARGVTSVHVAPVGSRFGGQGVLVKLRPDGEQTGRIAVPKAGVTATYVLRRGTSATPASHLSVFDRYKDELEKATDYKESWDKYDKKLAKYKKALAAWEKKQAEAKKAAEAKKGKQPPKKTPPKGKQPPKKTPPKGKQPPKKAPPRQATPKKTPPKKTPPKKATAKPAAKKPDPKPKEPKKPKENEHLAVLQGVLEGKRTLLLLVDAAEDIESAMRLATKYKIKLTLVGATEAYRVAAQIAKGGHRVILGPPAGPDVTSVSHMRRTARAAAELAARGVAVAISSDSTNGRLVRYLRFFASRAVAQGMRPGQALAALTGNAAKAVGVAGKLGTLAPGKDADFVVLDGAPFALATRVEQVYIDGELTYRRKK